MIKLVLPYPPSTDNLDTVSGGRKILSTEGRRYKLVAQAAINRAYPGEPLMGDLVVRYDLYQLRRADWDNFIKAAQDACTGLVWVDDKQISEAHVYRHKSGGNPRVEITIGGRV